MSPELSDKTVGVMGSSSAGHQSLAADVGRLLATLKVNLLTGGGLGVMKAVSEAFVTSRQGPGICIGVIPCIPGDPLTPKPGYPNKFVELKIYTHLSSAGADGADPGSRNHINILSCQAIIALPGGAGTATEVALALRYRKPIVIYSPNRALVEGFPADARRVDSLTAVDAFLKQHLR